MCWRIQNCSCIATKFETSILNAVGEHVQHVRKQTIRLAVTPHFRCAISVDKIVPLALYPWEICNILCVRASWYQNSHGSRRTNSIHVFGVEPPFITDGRSSAYLTNARVCMCMIHLPFLYRHNGSRWRWINGSTIICVFSVGCKSNACLDFNSSATIKGNSFIVWSVSARFI